MTIKIIATDMDGTFLDENGSYNRVRFGMLLKTLQDRGIRFVAASGNNMTRLNRIFDGFEKEVTFVAENGAHLVEEGKTIIHHSMPKDELKAFLNYFGDRLADYRTVVSGMTNTYRLTASDFSYRPGLVGRQEFEAFFNKIQALDDFSDIPQTEIISKMTMMVMDDYEAITKDFNTHFAGNLVAVASGYGAIDFIQKGIHKAWGLCQLMKRYGVKADEVMAFGDGDNDIEMLQLTPHSYAVENASDAVKVVAKHRIASHKENAVIATIEEWLLQG